jgi:hypothetical protein
MLAMFVSTTALAMSGNISAINSNGSECSELFKANSLTVPSDPISEIKAVQKTIENAEKIIIDKGGHTPETLLKIQAGTDLIFKDGATFAVSNPRYFSGLVRFDFQSPDKNSLVSPGREFELLVAGYPENNPSLEIVSNRTLSQNPRNSLKFIKANYKELQKIIPLRKFFRIAEDGSYAIVEKIPHYKGKLMTFEEFLKSKTLTMKDRELIGESLINFVRQTAGVQFISLHLPETIVFDPRDSKWKFLTIDSGMRRFKTDNFTGSLKTNIEQSLKANKLGDKVFAGALYRELDKLEIELLQEGARQSKLAELKARVPLAGKYKFNFVLNSGDRIQGELDSTSAARMNNEPIQFKGTHFDKNGKIKETVEKAFSVQSIHVGRPSFGIFKVFNELNDYYAIPLPTEVNKPTRVNVGTYGEVEIVRTE